MKRSKVYQEIKLTNYDVAFIRVGGIQGRETIKPSPLNGL